MFDYSGAERGESYSLSLMIAHTNIPALNEMIATWNNNISSVSLRIEWRRNALLDDSRIDDSARQGVQGFHCLQTYVPFGKFCYLFLCDSSYF